MESTTDEFNILRKEIENDQGNIEMMLEENSDKGLITAAGISTKVTKKIERLIKIRIIQEEYNYSRNK